MEPMVLNATLKAFEVMVDFEIAMWEGIQKVFPNTMIYVCYFHLKQATLRWMRGKH